MPDILIAGDWVVDEYWYLVRQHSEISSHTGFVHYRSSSKPAERILDLCSAGHVARVLFTLRSKPGPYYKIWGIGDWNQSDTDHLLHLIHAHEVNDCQAPRANFSLGRSLCDNPPYDITLLPLHENRQTTRVVRLFHSTGIGIEQLSRIDWEVPPEEKAAIDKTGLPEGLPDEEAVTSIVIHDLCKGAVTPELVSQLSKRYPSANWYVRTKSREPTWLKEIKNKVALFLVGPEVAEPGNPWGSWLSGAKISYQSFTYLCNIEGKATLVLSDNREVIGRINDGMDCVTAKAPLPDAGSPQVGWPSALLAALVHLSHTHGNTFKKDSMEKALLWAYEYAGVPVEVASGTRMLVSDQPAVQIEAWATQQNEWNQAMNNMGIIITQSETSGDPKLEVWRGASDLPGYVACVEGKRARIIEIGKRLRSFSRSGDLARSLSVLLQADPGSGKTHLAKLLARKFEFVLLTFDITQMLHRDDLLDLFDAVATEQANKPGRRVLVVVDEINAYLDTAAVYSSFLAPLEQGIYIRRGRVFSLKPCVWIFAGTDPDMARQAKSVKVSDFEQRLTTTVKLDYKSLRDEAKNDKEKEEVRLKAKLEQVYLGATMIQQRYPDVERVGLSALQMFYDLDPEKSPARKIRKTVEELRNVQRGIVTIQNVSPDLPRDPTLVRLVGKA
ncbi:MAG TPA: ATP-binding protein [Thermoanaerobaculia bacterium]|nr:ATP-binding protein [Thermoanaerobaculia bacterium]